MLREIGFFQSSSFAVLFLFMPALVGLFPLSVLAQQIMSYEEYQQLNHEEPYVYKITADTGKLLYFGSRHSFDPEDAQMDSLRHAFNNFSPNVVLTEAYPENFDHSVNMKQAIRSNGEFGLIWKLAKEQNIPVRSLEPEREDEVKYLQREGWPDIKILIFYTLRQVAQSHRQGQSVDLTTLLPKYLASLKEQFSLDGPETLESYEAAVDSLLPDVEEWQTISVSYFYPGPQDPEYFTNRIATATNIFRDRHHVQVIADAVKKGQKVFVVVGSAHAVMQEPALRAILGGE